MRCINEDIVVDKALFSNVDFALTGKRAKSHYYESSSDEDYANYYTSGQSSSYMENPASNSRGEYF